jgi:hypothetical protein
MSMSLPYYVVIAKNDRVLINGTKTVVFRD